ncbi:uncharacterized protein LOC130451440 isoform X1 [Diorhabda sublineata]|uniref:uncharacterized protein LOC130451440 isoform X1 n=1 Tax=Diorhabda sublineata TaxID=1163346 RepID=UPI0024E12F10|nr:uncharacterized protein LOC130451440 isoform X1 [Diorhabda sublineata]
MSGPLKWILLLIVVTVRAQEPRRRSYSLCPNDYLHQQKLEIDKLDCTGNNIKMKKFDSSESGPFWANRGKKDPVYIREPLFAEEPGYAEEPYWMVVRSDNQEEPFFVSRGKKENGFISGNLRETREFLQDNDVPFFAARGKKFKIKN